MLSRIRKSSRKSAPINKEFAPAVPDGQRVYAIGDVHGRLDLLDALLEAVADDDAAREGAQSRTILLGDLVDRGPDSRGVVERARLLARQPDFDVLGGNHEDMFLLSFRKEGALRSFLRYGGRETLLSYGMDPDLLHEGTLAEVQAAMIDLVPDEHRRFLDTLEDSIRVGDYLFVHAGIDPEIPLEQQRRQDLRWIREPFLGHEEPLDVMVVHGHTIHPDPQFLHHRIGIDTGAYDSGRLTALALEGTARRIIQAVEDNGAITIAVDEVNQ